MKLETFFKNFDLLADAPNGVQKLREFILQLAVMGKLVPQDANDEPASVLLEKIKFEKKLLVKEGKIRKSQLLPQINANKILFDLPQGWIWTRLEDIIFSLTGGGTPSKNNPHFWNGNIPWASVKDLKNSKYLAQTIDHITESGLQKSSTNLIPKGRVIICTRMGLGKIAINSIDVAINQDLKALELAQEINIDYFYNFYLTQNIVGTGVTVSGIRQSELLNFLVPIPPLNEQHRIVAKVDELMSLCDRLSERQQKRRSTRTIINNAAIGQLLTAREPEVFNKSWQHICNNFDLLYSTPDNIGKLRQAILQLAVQGKLVPQDANDEPASVLLEKIKFEKELLVKEGKIKKDKLLPAIEKDEIPYQLPITWQWIRLTQIILLMDAGWSPACKNHPTQDESKWGVLKTTAVQELEYKQEEHKELPEELEPRPEYEVKLGDILITRAGPKNRVGICCLVKNTRSRLMISDKIIRFHLMEQYILSDFIALSLNSGFSKSFIENQKSGMAASQMNISQDKLKMTPISIPPLNEQKRIIVKVNQLMSLCDTLETKLTQSLIDSEKLMEAAVRQILAANSNKIDKHESVLLESIDEEAAKPETQTAGRGNKKNRGQDTEAVQLNLPLV